MCCVDDDGENCKSLAENMSVLLVFSKFISRINFNWCSCLFLYSKMSFFLILNLWLSSSGS
jgi:hypothetical protein